MRLLFDHNLSPALVSRLADLFPSSEHVFRVGLDTAADLIVCEYALENGLGIVTKDADYCELLGFRAKTPSVIWIRTGNCSTSAVEQLFRTYSAQILEVMREKKVRLLTLF